MATLLPLTAAHAPALVHMLVLVLRDGTEFPFRRGEGALLPAARAYFSDWGREGDHAWGIAHERGHVVAALWLRRPIEGGMPFVGLASEPAWRGRGLGAALLGAAIEHAREREIDLSLTVHVHNPAIRLYRRMGFREERWFEDRSTGLMIRMVRLWRPAPPPPRDLGVR